MKQILPLVFPSLIFRLSDVILKIDNTAITNRLIYFRIWDSHENVSQWVCHMETKEFDFSALQKNIPKTPLPVKFHYCSDSICPARANVVLENLSPKDSPEWMQKRLRSAEFVPLMPWSIFQTMSCSNSVCHCIFLILIRFMATPLLCVYPEKMNESPHLMEKNARLKELLCKKIRKKYSILRDYGR